MTGRGETKTPDAVSTLTTKVSLTGRIDLGKCSIRIQKVDERLLALMITA
jgi:hypothetical protein